MNLHNFHSGALLNFSIYLTSSTFFPSHLGALYQVSIAKYNFYHLPGEFTAKGGKKGKKVRETIPNSDRKGTSTLHAVQHLVFACWASTCLTDCETLEWFMLRFPSVGWTKHFVLCAMYTLQPYIIETIKDLGLSNLSSSNTVLYL